MLISAIAAGSPADTAGLLIGDVILEFAGEPVHDPDALVTLLRGDHVGNAATLGVLRGVKRQDVAVVIGERPSRRV